jgi:hypothetical protein
VPPQTRQVRTIAGKLRRNEDVHCWAGVIHLPAWKDLWIRWRIRDDELIGLKDRRRKREREGTFLLTVEDKAGGGLSPAQERAWSFLKENQSFVLQIVLTELAAVVRERYFGAALKMLDNPDCKDKAAQLIRLATTEGVKELLGPPQVIIHATEAAEIAYLSFRFATALDEEHGVTVLMQKFKVHQIEGGLKMNSAEQGDPMPSGSMNFSESDGSMPDGGSMMSSGGSEEQMPGGSMMSSGGSEDQMPGTSMMPSGGSEEQMPSGGMEQVDSGSPRIRPPDSPPGSVLPAQWEAGTVEVEFHDNVKPAIKDSGGGTESVRSPANVNLKSFNKILEDHNVIKVEPSFGTPEQEADRIQVEARTKGVDLPNLGSFLTLHFASGADVAAIAAELNRLPEVARAVPVPKAIPPQTPFNEPLLGTLDTVVPGTERQWYAFRCRANNAWAMSSGSGVVIADIDWGYRTTHQDLAGRLDLTRAYNSFDGGTNVSHGTSISHGTAVMGIAGAADNDLGIVGFAFGATLWPVQANSGPGPALGGNAWARAIDWVRTADSGGRRKVIILEVQTGSFGNYEMVPSVNAAIRTAIAAGVVVCVAAGNGDRDAGIDDSGSAIPDTGSILVGATEYHATQNRRAGFSNFNARVTVCAPGDPSHDLTCLSDGDASYRNGFGGTSGATPKVAATAALMLQVNPALTHAQIRTILRDTGSAAVTDPAKPVGTFLNAEAAVRSAASALSGATPRKSGPVVAWGANRLDAFVIGTDRALYHKWWNGSAWGPSLTGYEHQGGVCTSRPEAVAWAPNRLDVFVLGTDRALYHKWWNGSSWGPSLTGFEYQGGVCTSPPKAVAWGPNRLDVFVLGTDRALYHKWWNGSSWGPSLTGFEYQGGVCTSPPEAVAWGPNRLDVFVLGTDRALYHKWWNGSNWGPSLTGWESLGGVCTSPPKVVSWGPNRLDVFVLGTDRALYHKWWNGSSWGPSLTGWERLGVCTSPPEAVAWGPNRLDVFVLGTDRALYHKWWNGSGWGPSLTGFEYQGGVCTSPPRALAWGANRLDVFVLGTDRALYHKWWNGSSWGPSLTGYEYQGGSVVDF